MLGIHYFRSNAYLKNFRSSLSVASRLYFSPYIYLTLPIVRRNLLLCMLSRTAFSWQCIVHFCSTVISTLCIDRFFCFVDGFLCIFLLHLVMSRLWFLQWILSSLLSCCVLLGWRSWYTLAVWARTGCTLGAPIWETILISLCKMQLSSKTLFEPIVWVVFQSATAKWYYCFDKVTRMSA